MTHAVPPASRLWVEAAVDARHSIGVGYVRAADSKPAPLSSSNCSKRDAGHSVLPRGAQPGGSCSFVPPTARGTVARVGPLILPPSKGMTRSPAVEHSRLRMRKAGLHPSRCRVLRSSVPHGLPGRRNQCRSPEPRWNALNRACLILLSEPGIWLTIYLGRLLPGPVFEGPQYRVPRAGGALRMT